MTPFKAYFPPNAYRFKVRGSGVEAPVYAPPPIITPPPTPSAPDVTASAQPPVIQAPPAPAATLNTPEVVQARLDARRGAAKRRGLNSTILAGADEGGSQTQLGGGTKTLLGGG